MTAMGLLALQKMQSINANAVDIQTSWLPSVQALGDLRAGVITYRNVVREHMLAETMDEKKAQESLLEDIVASNNKIRAIYEPLITSPEERALYEEWGKQWDRYKTAAKEVIAISNKGTATSTHEAHELNTTTVNLIGLKADEILKQDIALNKKGAEGGRKGSQRQLRARP